MRQRKECKKLVAMFSLALVLLCAVPAMAQTDREGIFLKETKLQDGDSIFSDDILTYKKMISSEDQRATVVLPENLMVPEKGSAVEGVGTTVSGAVPIEATSQYMVSIPCMVRSEAVVDGHVTIDGITLLVNNRRQPPLGGSRASTELPAYEMNIYKTEADLNDRKPVVNGNTINLNTRFIIGITKANFRDIAISNTYTVELPPQVTAPETGSTQELIVTIDGADQKFGEITWTADSRQLSLAFQDFHVVSGGVDVSLDDLQNIVMGFECSLDKDNLVADANGKTTIEFENGRTLDIIVPELKPKPPEINKAVGTLEADGTVLWTINYAHPVSQYTGARPAKLVDTIPDKLEYVSGSGKVYRNDSTTPEAVSNLTYADGKLTYDIEHAALAGADKVKITYKTKLTESAWSELWALPSKKYTYENRVAGLDAGDAALTPPVSALAKLDITADWQGRTVLSKEATVTGTGDNRTIKWKLTVNAQEGSFRHLNVIDTMGIGLVLQDSTIRVVNESNPSAAYTPSIITELDGRTTMTIKLVENNVPAAAGKYTITYETKIDQKYFNNPGSLTDADISNSARLDYSWPAGVGPAAPAMPPTIGKTPGNIGVNNALIQKTAASYDYADNAITWNITINPNGVNLTKAVFEDDLGTTDKRHVFTLDDAAAAAARQTIESSIKTAMVSEGISDTALGSVTLNDNVLKVELGNIGTETFTFSVKTYVSDPESWAGNGSKAYDNKVTMLKDVTIINTTPITADANAAAQIKPVHDVLKKACGKYIPEKKKIEWTLTVNEHAVNLGDVTITDVLSDILSCSAEDVADATIDGAAFSGADTFSFDSVSNTVTARLDQVNTKKVIRFTTSVDVDSELFHTQENISISNKAGLVSDANGSIVESNTVDTTLVNQVIDKKGEKQPGNVLSYRIDLNPYGMNLLEGKPTGTKLTVSDQLPDGLYLDMDSIEVYTATADPVSPSSGKYTVLLDKGPKVTDAVIDYRASDNAFSIEIPDPSKSYIVIYNAYIVKAGVYLKNNVKIEGSVLQGDETHLSSQYSYRYTAFGSAEFALPRDKFLSLQIRKVDKAGAKLTGAEFALYADKKAERLLAKGTTDDGTGICTLAIPQSVASGIDTLYWKEIKAPTGYELNDEWHEVTAASMTGAEITMVNLQAADAVDGKIKLKKTDESGAVLTGASFAVYKDESCETLAAAEKPVNASGEVTFEGLYPNRTYWVKELTTPKGYVPLDPVSVAASSEAVTPVTRIVNIKANAALAITKIDGENNAVKIENVEFAIYEDPECTIQTGETVKTDQQGTARFENLMPHSVYYLKETKAAPDYMENPQVYTITTGDNNVSIPLEIINFKLKWNEKASIEIIKTDSTGTHKLEQAVFELYADDKTTLLGEETTDQDGLCTFAQLKEGSYYIKEVKAPEGYQLNDSLIGVQVSLNTKETVTVKNILLDRKEEDTSGPGNAENNGKEEGEAYKIDTTYDKFTQDEPPINSTIPKTGVEDHIIWYAVGLAASFLVFCGLVLLLIRRRNRS